MSKFRMDMAKFKREMNRRLEHVTQPTTFGEMFNPDFMARNTNCSSIDEFFRQSGYPAATKQDIEAIPDAEFDAFVASATRFASWKEMIAAAGQELVDRRAREVKPNQSRSW